MALALVTRAEAELLRPAAEGQAPPSVKELQAAVSFAMDLLVKLPKLKPEDEAADDAGVDVLRQMLADPGSVVERLHANPKFKAALKAKGWLPPPDRPHHRPSKAQVAEREEYEQRAREQDEGADEDDSELMSMLKGATK